jgi:ribulose-phosphate 3-epimerase
MVQIIPAILTNNPQDLEDLLSQAEGVVDRVQIDIIDGVFADNKTVHPSAFEKITTSLNLDFHLMTKEPINWVEAATRAMADRIIGQVEMMESQTGFIEKVQEVGLLAGLAIDLDTPVSEVDSVVLASLDVVLVMGVPAGFGGQEFNNSALTKIKTLDRIRKEEELRFSICVDGGVTEKSIADIVKAKADEVVIGKKIFEGGLKKNIEKLLR